jgi:hypothetical protein
MIDQADLHIGHKQPDDIAVGASRLFKKPHRIASKLAQMSKQWCPEGPGGVEVVAIRCFTSCCDWRDDTFIENADTLGTAMRRDPGRILS